jgi:hypothetical protein
MNTEYKYYHFGPFLMVKRVERSLYDALCEDIKNVVAKEQIDFRYQLVGKIDKEYEFNPELTEKYAHILIPYISEYINNLIYDWTEFGKKNSVEDELREIERDMCLISLWVNFQKKNEYNPIHTHVGDISFVLYVDVPDVIYEEESSGNGAPNGTIKFIHALHPEDNTVERGRAHQLLKNALRPLTGSGSMKPTNGDLIIFPSYLNHCVEAFKSDVTRVSVSGNFTMMPSQ